MQSLKPSGYSAIFSIRIEAFLVGHDEADYYTIEISRKSFLLRAAFQRRELAQGQKSLKSDEKVVRAEETPQRFDRNTN